MRFCIPTDLQTHFKRKSFKISLKSDNYKDSKRLSLYLNDFIKEIYNVNPSSPVLQQKIKLK